MKIATLTLNAILAALFTQIAFAQTSAPIEVFPPVELTCLKDKIPSFNKSFGLTSELNATAFLKNYDIKLELPANFKFKMTSNPTEKLIDSKNGVKVELTRPALNLALGKVLNITLKAPLVIRPSDIKYITLTKDKKGSSLNQLSLAFERAAVSKSGEALEPFIYTFTFDLDYAEIEKLQKNQTLLALFQTLSSLKIKVRLDASQKCTPIENVEIESHVPETYRTAIRPNSATAQ